MHCWAKTYMAFKICIALNFLAYVPRICGVGTSVCATL